MSSTKYRTEIPDITVVIKDLERRIAVLERSPRIGKTTIDSGGLTVNGGDIIVKDTDGVEVIRIFQGDPPEIRFAPLGGDTDHVASIYSNDEERDGEDQTVGRFQIREVPGLDQDGGSLEIYNNGVKFGHIDAASGDEASYEAGTINGETGILRIVGRWLNLLQVGTTDAIFSGTIATGAANSVTLTYNFTYASDMVPIIGFVSPSGAVAWSITAQSASSFTVSWGGAAAVKTLNMWNIRV